MPAWAEQLQPSELGTKEHWDEAYDREIANHAGSTGDEGTIWFSDAGAEERVSSWLEEAATGEHKPDYRLCQTQEHGEPTSFLDLGTGNGHMLFELRNDGWKGSMVGIDYSAKSVELCRQIMKARTTEAQVEEVVFEHYDLLSSSDTRPAWRPEDGFDVVLDKGTFDAISLSADTDVTGRRINEGYAEKVEPFVKDGGFFIITSCNWTEDEVRHWFDRPSGSLRYADKIKYPSFTFGGKTGSQVCTLIFQKTH